MIYGPPGVGKLTVAKELSKLTGHKIFHNHLTIDLLESVLDRSNKRFWELLDAYRLQLIELAAEEKVDGMIVTSVNIKGKDDKFIKDILKIMEKHSGSTHFIRLNCELPKLKERLKEPSRKQHNKLMDIDIFNEFVSKNEVFSPIAFVESLEINNTNITAEETAIMIKKHYKL